MKTIFFAALAIGIFGFSTSPAQAEDAGSYYVSKSALQQAFIQHEMNSPSAVMPNECSLKLFADEKEKCEEDVQQKAAAKNTSQRSRFQNALDSAP